MLCTRCGSYEAEWMEIDGHNLCQLCWELHCSVEWWNIMCGDTDAIKEPKK